MAATGYTPIQLYYSTTAAAVPSAGNLASGELAINITDGKLYYKSNAGVVTLLAGAGGSGIVAGSNTQVQYNNNGVFGASANMTFNGTILTSTGFAGPLNGTVGATTANTGAFTTLSATGQITSTAGGTGIFLNNGTSNLILYTTAGLSAPTFTTRSAGTKLVLYPALSSSAGDFGFGTEPSVLWSSVPTTSNLFRWYGGTTVAASLSGAGRLIATEYIGANGATPTQALTVNGNALINDGAWYGWGDADERIVGNNTGFMQYFVGGSEQMRLTSTGLGIGTSSPVAKLDVQGILAISNSGASYWAFDRDNSSGSLTIGDTGTQRMELTTSGNLGLGVTPSAWTAGKAFQLAGTGLSGSVFMSDSGVLMLSNNYKYSGGDVYNANGYATRYYQYAGQHIWNTASSGTAGNAITFTQAMTLDASGNLMVGTSSGTKKLVVQGSTADRTVEVIDNGSNDAAIMLQLSGVQEFTLGVDRTDSSFRISDSGALGTNDRLVIDSSGNLLVGTTSTSGVQLATAGGFVTNGIENFWLSRSAGGGSTMNVGRTSGAGTGTLVEWTYNGGVRGSISTDGTSVAYNTSSDYRLKNTITPMTGALAKVALLKPCTYKWNADGSDGEGFIAHELAEVVPQCVTGEKDAVDENGNPKYQGIDTSFLVATVVAALQELKAEFDAYKASHP